MKSRKKCTHRTGGVVPKSQKDECDQENSNVAPSKHLASAPSQARKTQLNPACECHRLYALVRNGDATTPQKFIVFKLCSIYNDIARSSREHDQWRLSMRLSSFPVVVLRWENSRAVSPI